MNEYSSLESQTLRQYLENQYIFENAISTVEGEFKYLLLTTSILNHFSLEPANSDTQTSTWVYRYRSDYDNQEGLFTISFRGDDVHIELYSPTQNQYHRIPISAMDPLYQQWIVHLHHSHIELLVNPELTRLFKKTLNIV